MLNRTVHIERYDALTETRTRLFRNIPVAIGRAGTDLLRNPQAFGQLADQQLMLYVNRQPRSGIKIDEDDNETPMGTTDMITLRVNDEVVDVANEVQYRVQGVNNAASQDAHLECPLEGVQTTGDDVEGA